MPYRTVTLNELLDATMNGTWNELFAPDAPSAPEPTHDGARLPQGVGSTDTPEGPQQAHTLAAPVFRLIRGGCHE